MTRVQNLLPTVATAHPEADTASTSGRDFDDVLAQTYRDRSRDQSPASDRQPFERRSDTDRPTRAEQPTNVVSNSPKPTKTVEHQQYRPPTTSVASGPQRLDDTDTGELTAPSSVRSATGITATSDAPADHPVATEPGDGARTDILAEPVAGVIVDPALLAAMVTTAPTVLTPATAPEPEAGMLSVAAVDGGTAVIVTAPGTPTAPAGVTASANATAVGTSAVVGSVETTPSNGTPSNPTGGPTQAAPAPITAPMPVPMSPDPAGSSETATAPAILDPARTPATEAAPAAPAAPATPTAPTAPAAFATGSASGTPHPDVAQLATTLPPATGAVTTPLNPIAVEGDSATTDARIVGAPLDTAPDTAPATPASGTTPGGAAALAENPAIRTASGVTAVLEANSTTTNGADVVSPATRPASAPTVDPVAAALAVAYGTERTGALGNPSGLTLNPSGPDGSIGAQPQGGIPVAVLPNGADGSTGSGTERNSNPDGSGAHPTAASPSDLQAVSTPGVTTTAATTAAAIPVTPGTPGIPVAGINGVNGVTGTAPAITTPTDAGDRLSATSEITDQVAAQIGRQLQGTRMLSDGTHHTVLRLSPEHLGEVTITLDVRAGGIRLDLAAGSQALAALQADLGQLRDDLANSGLNLGDVTLSSRDVGPDSQGQAATRERWQDPGSSGRERPGDGPAGSATPADQPLRRETGSPRGGGLDVLA